MKKGYVISKTRSAAAYFTSSSSFDRPVWTNLTEATVYPSAEMADKAFEKLVKYGAYGAIIVELASLDLEMPDDQDSVNLPPEEQGPTDDQMTAGSIDDEGDEDVAFDDDDEAEDFERRIPGREQDLENEDEFDDKANLDPHSELREPGMEENEIAQMTPAERLMMKGHRPSFPNGSGPKMGANAVGESEFKMPNKPQLDGKPAENKKTALDGPKPEKIKFSQSLADERDSNFAADIEPLYKNAVVPANVMSALKDTIKMFDDAADFNNGRDDSQASFALTVADALRSLEDCLAQGTHEGIKQAQIRITSFMNPITSNIPNEVTSFLYKFGRQSTNPSPLKTLFYDKWDSKRGYK